MKRKTTIRIVVVITISALFVTATGGAFYAGRLLGVVKTTGEGIILADVAHNGTILLALRYFRENDADHGLDILESSLDAQVITFGFVAEELSPEMRESTQARLVAIKKYRLKYPRDWAKEEGMEPQINIDSYRAAQSMVEEILAKVEVPEDADE